MREGSQRLVAQAESASDSQEAIPQSDGHAHQERPCPQPIMDGGPHRPGQNP